MPLIETKPFTVSLAIATPLNKLFHYSVPESILDNLPSNSPIIEGLRVQVNFNGKQKVGIVVAINQPLDFDAKKLKPIIELIDAQPLISPHDLELMSWVSQYYHYPLGEALPLVFTNELRKAKPAIKKTTKVWQLSPKIEASPANSKTSFTEKQTPIVNWLKEHDKISSSDIKTLGFSKAVIQTMVKNDLLNVFDQEQPAAISVKNSEHLTLNDQQQTCLDALNWQEGFQVHLVEGITGSGKTELYLQWVQQALNDQKQVLILVPEIGLTGQTISRFASRFNTTIALLHSAISPAKRKDAWLDAQRGDAQIVIGTRSAVFQPMPNLGLIIIDEEHDPSFKQADTLRYQARDVAIKKAHLANIPIVLGSATPALESLHNALGNKFSHHRLDKRPGEAKTAFVETVDLRKQQQTDGFSAPMLSRVQQHLDSNHQVLLFLNRRGYAPTWMCADCGWVCECPNCDARLTVHGQSLRCHHCGFKQALLSNCVSCNSHNLIPLGSGTQRSEQFLLTQFANYPVIRLDKDSTQSADQFKQQLTPVLEGKPCIILGTQLLAKGHHFENVTLVGILDADSGLFSADFRAEERMGQMLTQVAGRSGRGKDRGEVLIQTYHVDHPLMDCLVEQNYHQFALNQLQKRQAAMLPPFCYMAIIQMDHSDLLKATAPLAQLAKFQWPQGVVVMGPMTALMAKRANLFRVHLVVKSKKRSALHAALAQAEIWLRQHYASMSWHIDVDPNELV